MAPLYNSKTAFWKEHPDKPLDSISVYLLTDKAIITELDQNIAQIELYKNCTIWGQKGRAVGHVTYF